VPAQVPEKLGPLSTVINTDPSERYSMLESNLLFDDNWRATWTSREEATTAASRADASKNGSLYRALPQAGSRFVAQTLRR